MFFNPNNSLAALMRQHAMQAPAPQPAPQPSGVQHVPTPVAQPQQHLGLARLMMGEQRPMGNYRMFRTHIQ